MRKSIRVVVSAVSIVAVLGLLVGCSGNKMYKKYGVGFSGKACKLVSKYSVIKKPFFGVRLGEDVGTFAKACSKTPLVLQFTDEPPIRDFKNFQEASGRIGGSLTGESFVTDTVVKFFGDKAYEIAISVDTSPAEVCKTLSKTYPQAVMMAGGTYWHWPKEGLTVDPNQPLVSEDGMLKPTWGPAIVEIEGKKVLVMFEDGHWIHYGYLDLWAAVEEVDEMVSASRQGAKQAEVDGAKL